MINCNFNPIFHRFPNSASYSFKLSIEICNQTAADGEMVTIDSPLGIASALSDGAIANP